MKHISIQRTQCDGCTLCEDVDFFSMRKHFLLRVAIYRVLGNVYAWCICPQSYCVFDLKMILRAVLLLLCTIPSQGKCLCWLASLGFKHQAFVSSSVVIPAKMATTVAYCRNCVWSNIVNIMLMDQTCFGCYYDYGELTLFALSLIIHFLARMNCLVANWRVLNCCYSASEQLGQFTSKWKEIGQSETETEGNDFVTRGHLKLKHFVQICNFVQVNKLRNINGHMVGQESTANTDNTNTVTL